LWGSGNGFPEAWRQAFCHFDEIWVPSRFVAEGLRRLTSLPVVVMPHVLQPRPVELSRADFSLPENRFVFLSIFDEASGFHRKNPLAAIAAFKRAFPADHRGVALYVKARALSQANRARLTTAASGYPISVFVEDLGHKALSALVAHVDAFVSLHRAEGFGLAIAEAMQLGRPVIATAYSGNLDYMTPENSYLVPYRMARPDEADGVFPAGTEWADPDLDAAAEMMRAIVGDPVAARGRAERGAADVAAKFSPLAVAQRIEQRLSALRSRLEERKSEC
jgi:glycosyltransferase involved in cell wall biosynthesis